MHFLRADFREGDEGSNFSVFQSPAVHWTAQTSSLNCLSCRKSSPNLQSLNASPLFTEKPFLHRQVRRIHFPQIGPYFLNQDVLNSTPLNPTPATCHKRKRKLRRSSRKVALQDVILSKSCTAASEKLQCNFEKAALQESGAFLPLSFGFQAPTFRLPRLNLQSPGPPVQEPRNSETPKVHLKVRKMPFLDPPEELPNKASLNVQKVPFWGNKMSKKGLFWRF